MKAYKQSLISAHHNYLLNRTLFPGFVLGHPDAKDRFFLLADLVLPGESTPRLCARLFDRRGGFLSALEWNRMSVNPGHCKYEYMASGFRILDDAGECILDVRTDVFANGYLTHINGTLYDEKGKLRVETEEGGGRIHGRPCLALDSPYTF